MPGLPVLACVAALLAGGASAAPVAVDVGHFDEEPGAISARGVPEFAFNLSLARAIEAALGDRGVAVLLVGERGDMRALAGRTAAAARARFFLSVHHDSMQPHYLEPWTHEGAERLHSERFAGFALFVSQRNPAPRESLRCASAIGRELRAAGFTPSLYHAERIAGENRPFADRANGVHYFDNLAVLHTARQPAVLMEAGVILNRDEEARMSDPATHRRMGAAVADALVNCLRGR